MRNLRQTKNSGIGTARQMDVESLRVGKLRRCIRKMLYVWGENERVEVCVCEPNFFNQSCIKTLIQI